LHLQRLSNTPNLVVFIVTLLHVVETAMYLLMVWCFKSALTNDCTHENDQQKLIGLSFADIVGSGAGAARVQVASPPPPPPGCRAAVECSLSRDQKNSAHPPNPEQAGRGR
jgi:hypothetical protein